MRLIPVFPLLLQNMGCRCGSTFLTVLIRCALGSPDLAQTSKHQEHCRNMFGKYFYGLETQNFANF